MKKRELEQKQAQFRGNTKASGAQLQRRVSADLNLVKDAYDIGSIALTELQKQLANVAFSEKPVKDLTELSRAYKDIAATLIALRGEGRTTIAEAVAQAGTELAEHAAPQALDPPSPPEGLVGDGTTQSPKISPPAVAEPIHIPTVSIGDAFGGSDDT